MHGRGGMAIPGDVLADKTCQPSADPEGSGPPGCTIQLRNASWAVRGNMEYVQKECKCVHLGALATAGWCGKNKEKGKETGGREVEEEEMKPNGKTDLEMPATARSPRGALHVVWRVILSAGSGSSGMVHFPGGPS